MTTAAVAEPRGGVLSSYGPFGPAAAVAVVCVAVAVTLNAVLIHQVGFSGDEAYYARIANHPAGPHNFPYAFRVGLPYLVHVLPFSHAFSWELLALLMAGAAGGALFAVMREFEIDYWLAGSLAVGFAISPPLLVVFLRNGIEVDAAAIMVIAFGCLFILRRQMVPLGITLLVGTTIHEACLFLIPLAYAVWAERPVDRRALRDLALAATVPALFYIYLRSSIVAVGERFQPGYSGSFLTARVNLVRDALHNEGWKTELRRIAIAFGPLWLSAPFALPRLHFVQRGLVLVGVCVVAMTFALDWGRMAFFAAPVVYVAGAYAVKDRRRLAIAVVVGLLALDVGYAIYMQVHGVKHGLDTATSLPVGPVS